MYPLWWSLCIGLKQRPPSARAPPRRRGLLPSPTFFVRRDSPPAQPPPPGFPRCGDAEGADSISLVCERESARDGSDPPLAPPSHTRTHTHEMPPPKPGGEVSLPSIQYRGAHDVKKCTYKGEKGGVGGESEGRHGCRPFWLTAHLPCLPPFPVNDDVMMRGEGSEEPFVSGRREKGGVVLLWGGGQLFFSIKRHPPLPSPPRQKKNFQVAKILEIKAPKDAGKRVPENTFMKVVWYYRPEE